ncbi:MAG: hypothetical protein ABIC40_04375, partial [bacterium]
DIAPIPITSLYMMDRDGSDVQAIIFPFDISIPPLTPSTDSLIRIDLTNYPASVDVTMHQPMFPNLSPDGQNIIFMDCPLTFTIDIATGTFSNTTHGADVYRIASLPDQFWSDAIAVADTNQYEIFPDWGLGNVLPAHQNNTDPGFATGMPISLANASTTSGDPSFTEAERQAIATDLGEASLALRKTDLLGVEDQNWLMKDLPYVPEQTVDILGSIADVTCFRDPCVTYDPRYPDPGQQFPQPILPDRPLQAYPGRVNINTATRPVLRTVFLNMFQGPLNNPDDDSMDNGPEPRIEGGGVVGDTYLNLMALDNDLGDYERFMAIMVADKYAKQVEEYRKWIYNNLGSLGITDETVSSDLPLYQEGYAGVPPPVTHYGNFRANPFYPLIDTDLDGKFPDVPKFDPEPPFRSIADLFKVTTYDNRTYDETWNYEGIDGDGGPDPLYIPEPLDPSGTQVGTVDAYDIFGPIYNTSDERWCTHPSAGYLAGGILFGYSATVDNDFTNAFPVYNNFYEHQQFRLFSADDFKRIAPYITVRSYNYRIESRGDVRISSGNNRTDVTRDKVWIISTNTEASFGNRLNPIWDISKPLDDSSVAQNRGLDQYYVLYFEETPQSGIGVATSKFLPD